MTIWVLIFALSAGPFAAYKNHTACEEAYNKLPENHPPADCFPFAADIAEPSVPEE